jgi:large subunit ribosomal protein L20
VRQALQYSYRDRRNKKREFRRLWIARVNAAARQQGVSYSQLIHGLRQRDLGLDRKTLADMAVRSPEAFSELVAQVKGEVKG